MEILKIMKTGRNDACNLAYIGSVENAATITMNANITNTKYHSIVVIDQSPTGLFERHSANLKDL